MAHIIMDIINPTETSSEASLTSCAKCQQREKSENLKNIQQKEYCHPCYSEVVREISERLPNITPQLEIVK